MIAYVHISSYIINIYIYIYHNHIYIYMMLFTILYYNITLTIICSYTIIYTSSAAERGACAVHGLLALLPAAHPAGARARGACVYFTRV